MSMHTLLLIPTPLVQRNVGRINPTSDISVHDASMDERLPFGDRLKSLRKARGMRQADAAEAIGISRSYLAGLEAGKDLPGRDALAAIATFYGISMDAVAASIPPKPPRTGEFIEDPDEIALLQFWRDLPIEGKRMVVRLLNPPGVEVNDDAA